MYETQRALINQRRGGSRWLRRHGEARSLRSEKGLKRTLDVIARRATNCGTVCTRGIISISIWARNGEGDAGRVLVTGCSSRDMRGRIILHVRRFLIYESTAQCARFSKLIYPDPLFRWRRSFPRMYADCNYCTDESLSVSFSTPIVQLHLSTDYTFAFKWRILSLSLSLSLSHSLLFRLFVRSHSLEWAGFKLILFYPSSNIARCSMP